MKNLNSSAFGYGMEWTAALLTQAAYGGKLVKRVTASGNIPGAFLRAWEKYCKCFQ